jgi:2-dehydropantoate 2-reductase
VTSDTRPLAVLGPGGVGGMLAARTGALCIGTSGTVSAIRDRGIRLEHLGVTTVTRVEAVERLEQSVGLLVVAVKATALEAALDRIAPGTLDGAVVLPLLNGLEHLEVIRARTGAVVAAASIGRLEVAAPEPGRVVQTTAGAVVTAASEELGIPALRAALDPLAVPTIELVVGVDERAVLWDKAARMAVLAAATVASARSLGWLRADPSWHERLWSALTEACSVARADGSPIDPAEQWAIIEAMPEELTTSAARDAAAGRRTELDAITGAVVRAGRRHAVATPALERLLADALA